MPHRMLGLTMLPPVSLPMEKPTRPAAVAAPGPALEPDAPSSRSHGFTVWPPNRESVASRRRCVWLERRTHLLREATDSRFGGQTVNPWLLEEGASGSR